MCVFLFFVSKLWWNLIRIPQLSQNVYITKRAVGCQKVLYNDTAKHIDLNRHYVYMYIRYFYMYYKVRWVYGEGWEGEVHNASSVVGRWWG